MKIVNCRNQVIPLPVGDPLKPHESRIIPDHEWLIVSHDRIMAAWLKAGVISVLPDPQPDARAEPVPEMELEPAHPSSSHKHSWRERFVIPKADDDGDVSSAS